MLSILFMNNAAEILPGEKEKKNEGNKDKPELKPEEEHKDE